MKSELESGQLDALNQDKKQTRSQVGPLKRGLKRSNGKIEWQQRVYKIGKDEGDIGRFHEISKEIFKRDDYKCQSCLVTRYKLSMDDKFLTCHHIIPRSENGSDAFNNLITLCNECHDKIEELALKTSSEICGYFSEEKRHWTRAENIGSKWQEWVYGGRKRPK